MGVFSSFPMIKIIKIIAHNKISKNPKGIKSTVKIIVKTKLIIPMYKPHRKFFKIPAAERSRIIVKLKNKGNKTIGWFSKK